MKLRLCCVPSRIDGALPDFFVIFAVGFMQVVQVATGFS